MFVISGLQSCTSGDESSGAENRDGLSAGGQQQAIAAQFASIAQKAVIDRVVEGIQFSIVENGKILQAGAFGLADRERDRPMTVDTPINVASISKPLTAWGMLALTERSILDLDTKLSELSIGRQLYAELFSGADVSFRMLLSHTSGLSGASVPVTPATEPVPGLTDILLGNSSVPRPTLARPPGGSFLYSGAGYLVLQKIIEDQSQREFADYMASTVLKPARMFESTFSLTPEVLERVAVYYRDDGRRRAPYHLSGAAGGLYSTANDMARFICLYTDSGRSIRRQIISDEGFAALLSPVVNVAESEERNGNVHYALGHYTYDTPEGAKIVYHSGGNPGLRALFVVAPERNVGFFAVTNNDRGSQVLSDMLSSWSEYYGITLHAHL